MSNYIFIASGTAHLVGGQQLLTAIVSFMGARSCALALAL